MWILIQEPKGGGPIEGPESGVACWGFLPGGCYTIGREGKADIEGVVNDASVSQVHGKFTVGPIVGGDKPKVVLEDMESKFGIHLNSGILSESQRRAKTSVNVVSKAIAKPTELKDNDRIRFGVMYSIFRLRWISLSVTSSMLRNKKSVEGWLGEIQQGIKLEAQWSETTTHLVMNSISLSLKVVNCLAKGVPIVTPEYFRDLASSLQSKQRLPNTSDFVPLVTENQSESQLRDPEINFRVNKQRSKLFSGLTMVFMTEKDLNANLQPIALAGGSTSLWNGTRKISDLSSPNIVVIQPRNSASQPPISSDWASIVAHLSSKGLTACPATNIYLAIVHNSRSTFCNPNRRAPVVLPVKPPTQAKAEGSIQVPETLPGESIQLPLRPSGTVRINETLSSKCTTPNNTSLIPPIISPLPTLDVLEHNSQTENIVEKSKNIVEKSENIVEKSGKQVTSRNTSNILLPSSIPNISRKRNREEEKIEGNTIQTETGVEDFTVPKVPRKFTFSQRTPHMTESQNTQEIKIQSKDEERERGEKGKRVLSPQSQSSPAKKLKMFSSTKDPDDIFGFDEESPVKKKSPVKVPSSSLPKEDQKEIFEDDNDDDDLFNFSPEKKVPKVNSGALEVSKGASPLTSVISPKVPSKNVSREDENQNVTKGNGSCLSGVFIGKGDVSFKSDIKNEEEIGKSFCKITLNASLLRSSKPKPSYVQAPEPELLGRPTPNYKNFKKQIIGTPVRRVVALTRYVAPVEKSGVDDWIAQHQDVTRHEEEEQEREKQDEDMWNFVNSQEVRVKPLGRFRR